SGVASLNPGFEHPDFPKVLQDQLKAHSDLLCVQETAAATKRLLACNQQQH
ncbi:unnamed protein product, partial [Ectocarpus sp. 12 AP-2014]